MIRVLFLCLAVFALLSRDSGSHAAVTISSSVIDTPGLPGAKTWTLRAVSPDPIWVIDFVGNGNNNPATAKGFFGLMNQVNPAGEATVFEDQNLLFDAIGAQPIQDSQFKVHPSSVLVLSHLSEESANILQGVWVWGRSPGTAIPFAQIVIPENSNNVWYRGAVTVEINDIFFDFQVSGILGAGLPNTPPTIADASPAPIVAGMTINHQFTTSQGTEPVLWYLVADTANSPFAPTLTFGGAFSWNSAGAQPGTYVFDVTATNATFTDAGRLTIIVIPEPASLTLVAFAASLLALRRRF